LRSGCCLDSRRTLARLMSARQLMQLELLCARDSADPSPRIAVVVWLIRHGCCYPSVTRPFYEFLIDREPLST
jgi:hypothetical protein